MGKLKQPYRTKGGSLARRAGLGIFARLKSSRTARKIFTGAMPVFLVAFVAAFMASSIFAPAESSDAATTVSTTVSAGDFFINIESEAVSIDVDAYPGDGRTSVAKTTVKTKTNAAGGYKLFLGMDSAATGTGLCLDTDSSECIVTLAGATPSNQLVLGANTWGYAISSASSGVPNTWTTVPTEVTNAVPSDVTQTFSAVPVSGKDQLIQTGSANASASTDTTYTPVDVYYGVRATIAKPAGTYSNTVAYTAIADTQTTTGMTFSPASYARPSTLTAANVGAASSQKLVAITTIYTNWPGASTPTTAPTITLTGGPKNETYTCTNPTQYVEDNLLKVSCTLPQAYAANYTMRVQIPDFDIDFTQTYQYTVDWNTISFMQEMPFGATSTSTATNPANATVCSLAATPTKEQKNATSNPVPETFLADVRSGDKGGYIQSGKYRIRKLADGNCWMTENYAFPQQPSQTYYSYDTNLTVDKGTSLGYATSNGIISWKPSNTYTTQQNLSSCPSGGPTDGTATNDHTYYGNGSTCNSDTATTEDSVSATGVAKETQKIGAYYNWAAATARSGGDTAGTDAPNSVCPYGWRLPSGGANGTAKSFATLMSTYGYGNDSAGSTHARQYPLSYIFSGYYYWGNGYLYYQGADGRWWSTTSYGSSDAYDLLMNSSNLNPQVSYNKALGFTLRCVSL